MTDPQQGHAALVQSLDERGLLAPDWRAVWERTPRHEFIPEKIWRQGPQRCEPITNDADRWDLIYSDQPVVTQIDDGREGGPGVATSSTSMPSMVARMLGLLGAHEGTRVLEIGTATGQVADLLCGRCGDENVTSVEIDASLSATAKENLARRGHAPTLVVADGEHGYPAGAPYHRLIATCALRHVPLELVQQVEAGGLIVAPLVRDFWSGALVQLTVQRDGSAWGPFAGGASYMPMRSHRAAEGKPVDTSSPRSRWSDTDPGEYLSLPFALYAGARLPGVSLVDGEHEGAVRVWLQDGRGSGVVADAEAVTEFGPRDLWAELEQVHTEFKGLGEVDVTDFGLTVAATGQHVWFRTPDNVITPL